MTRIWADLQFDQGNLDLNRIIDGFVESNFYDNANVEVHKVAYTDVFAATFTNNGLYFRDAFLGPNITVNPLTQVVTGGTITGYAEVVYLNDAWTSAWGFEAASVSALAIYNAANTNSTADDYNLINGVLAGADTFMLSNYSDTALGQGGNDSMFGNGGSDKLYGGLGNDSLVGGSGNDNLSGDAGIDRLIGGLGNDTVTGGSGADFMAGGGGRDNFIFNSLDAADVISDFTHGVDKIGLARSVMQALSGPGVLASTAFWSAAGATHGHDSTDRIIYNRTTGDLFYDADGSLGGAAVKIGDLDHGLALSYSDFFVI